jgi:hypothetical protein
MFCQIWLPLESYFIIRISLISGGCIPIGISVVLSVVVDKVVIVLVGVVDVVMDVIAGVDVVVVA